MLLEKIKNEQKTKKIVTDNLDYPFEVPESWAWCRLGDVCKFENGYAFSSEKYKNEGVPLIRISNIKDGSVDLSECIYVEKDNLIDDRFIVQNGDLLIAMSGATTGKMGVYNSFNMAYLNQRVGNVKISHKEIVYDKYRNYFLIAKSNEILKMAYGGAQPNISSKVMETILFPIPSISEQKRIVAQIEKIFFQLDEIEKSIKA